MFVYDLNKNPTNVFKFLSELYLKTTCDLEAVEDIDILKYRTIILKTQMTVCGGGVNCLHGKYSKYTITHYIQVLTQTGYLM